jgi:hypothetical protein
MAHTASGWHLHEHELHGDSRAAALGGAARTKVAGNLSHAAEIRAARVRLGRGSPVGQ